MDNLRQQLKVITDDGDVDTHPSRIALLRASIPHTIETLHSQWPLNRYNCVAHALGIAKEPAYIKSRFRPGPRHANTAFVQRLIDRHVVEQLEAAQVGCLVVYDNGASIQHIGKLQEGLRVESKWGIGHLYQHEVFEVSAEYGAAIRFFGSIAPAVALNEYEEYVCGR